MKKVKSVSLLLAALILTSCSTATVTDTSEPAATETTATEQTTEITTEQTNEETETVPTETVPEGPYDISEIETTGGRIWINDDPQYDRLIQLYKYDYDSHGAYVVATDDDILILYVMDNTEVDGVTPVDQYTTFDIASCSKLFTAACIFRLEEQGLISLDDTLDMYFPEYEDGSRITIYNMLHMSSGIPDYINDPITFWHLTDEIPQTEQDAWDFVAMFPEGFFGDEVSDEEFIEYLSDTELLFEPGSMFEYSNTNYRLLAMIVEQVSGMGFDEYLQENIFDPCGMEHTTIMIPGDETSVSCVDEDMVAAGMVDEYGHTIMTDWGDGGIHTCLADLLAFDRALFNGEIVSEESFAEMNNMVNGYGCGLMPYEGTNGVYHSGGAFAYTSLNIIRSNENYGHVYVINLMTTW